MKEPLKSKLPVHSPSKEVWLELESRLDDPTFGDYNLSQPEAPDRAWEKIERKQNKPRQPLRTVHWLKIAAAVALLFTIPLVILLMREAPPEVRHSFVIAQTQESRIEESETSAYGILSAFYTTTNPDNPDVSGLLEELRVLEQDKNLIVGRRQNDDSPQLRQMLMEIEMDLAALVRDISNKMR